VDRRSVIEGDDSKVTIPQFRDARPESISVVILTLDAKRILEDRDTPLTPQVRSLAKDDCLEILSESVIGHAP